MMRKLIQQHNVNKYYDNIKVL